MLIIYIISIIVILAGFVLLFLKLNEMSKPSEDKGLFQQQLEGIRSQLNMQMGQINEQISKQYSENHTIIQKVNTDVVQTLQNVDKNVNARLDNAAKAVSEVSKRLGEVYETTKNVQEIGKDIASLQEILRSPKMRGGLGELFLGDLLSQVLPSSRFELQYKFKSREIVDAVIFLKDLIVPIDSKFPLENFKKISESQTDQEKVTSKRQFVKDVKKHINDISQKYILPDEGTSDFALMYIPAENVYYEIIVKDEAVDDEKGLLKYALDKRIFPVSPNSFYGYLQTILLGLRGMKIEEQANEILRNISQLSIEFAKVEDTFQKMGTHLRNLYSNYEETEKKIGHFSAKLETLEEKNESPTELLPA